MKTLIIAAVTVIGFGTAAAYAATSDSQTQDANLQQPTGAVAQPAPGYAVTQTNQGAVNAYPTHGKSGIWLFPPNPNEGSDVN